MLAATSVLEYSGLPYPERTRRHPSAHALRSGCEVRDVVSPRMRVLAVSHSARQRARQRGTSFALEGANGSAHVVKTVWCARGTYGDTVCRSCTSRLVWQGTAAPLLKGPTGQARVVMVVGLRTVSAGMDGACGSAHVMPRRFGTVVIDLRTEFQLSSCRFTGQPRCPRTFTHSLKGCHGST